MPSRMMNQLFDRVNFVYRSVEVYQTFCSYLRVLVRQNAKLLQRRTDGINCTGDLQRYDHLFDKLMDKS